MDPKKWKSLRKKSNEMKAVSTERGSLEKRAQDNYCCSSTTYMVKLHKLTSFSLSHQNLEFQIRNSKKNYHIPPYPYPICLLFLPTIFGPDKSQVGVRIEDKIVASNGIEDSMITHYQDIAILNDDDIIFAFKA